MKKLVLFALICMCVIPADAHTVGYPSSMTGSGFIRVVNKAIEAGEIDMRNFSEWSDIQVLDSDTQGRALNGFSDLPNLTDYYYIVPSEKRFETENGLAYFVLAEALSYNQLHAEMHAKEEGKALNELDEIDRSDEFRWIIYLQNNGFLEKEKISEIAFQALIAKHRIAIGKPKPYRFSMDKHRLRIAEEVRKIREAKALETIRKPIDISQEPEIEEPAEVVTPKPSEELVEKSSNWWLWLIGGVVIVCGTVMLRPKSNGNSE